MTTDTTSNNLRELVFDLSLQSAVGTQLHSQEAIPFLRSVVREYYDVDANGEIRPNNKTPLDFNHEPLPIERIAEHLKFKHPYLFQPESAPSSNVQALAPKPIQKSRSEMSLVEKTAFIRRYGEGAYLDLPADPVSTLPTEEKRRSQMTLEERCAIIHERGSEFYESLPE